MTIAHLQSGGRVDDVVTSSTRAFGANVAVGSLIVVPVYRWNGTTSDPIVLGDFAQSAGTATLSAFTLDKSQEFNYSGSDRLCVACASAIVTGAGSCTITVSGAPANSWFGLATGEFSGTWDGTRLETTNTAQNTTGAPSAGSMTSAGAALFLGAVTHSLNSVALTQDAAWTLIYEQEGTSQCGGFIYRLPSGGLTDDADWTAPTTANWLAIGLVYKEVASSIAGDRIMGQIWQ